MGEILVDLGILDPVDLCRILAERRGYQFVDLRERPVDLSLMDLVPEEVARRYSALPIAHQDDHVVVAMAQPENVFALDDLRVLTELPVFPVMAEPQQISAAISRCYGTVEPETAAATATDAGAGVAANGAGTNGTAPAAAPSPLPEATEASGDTAAAAPRARRAPAPVARGGRSDHPPRQRALRASDPRTRDGRPHRSALRPTARPVPRRRSPARGFGQRRCRRCVR